MNHTEQFIEDAIEGGWLKDKEPQLHGIPGAVLQLGGGETELVSHWRILLDPLAWQAVGKTRGWNHKNEAKVRCKAFVSYLFDGKSIEDALANL